MYVQNFFFEKSKEAGRLRTIFTFSALRLLRQWVTGGANIDLEKSLAEGAGLRGGYSTSGTDVDRRASGKQSRGGGVIILLYFSNKLE